MDDRDLSDVLSEFARTLATDFPIQGILDHLVHRIVDVLPVDAAGVTLISPDADPRYVASSDESALRFERLRGSTAMEHAIQGSGLGLNIIESVAHNHGGEVCLVSAPGEGTTVTVTLPLLRCRAD